MNKVFMLLLVITLSAITAVHPNNNSIETAISVLSLTEQIERICQKKEVNKTKKKKNKKNSK